MNPRRFLPALAAVALLLTACETAPSIPVFDSKDGRVTINFVNPEKFTDARDSDPHGSPDYVVKELGQFLQGEIRRYLAPGEKFSVTVTDIDLAGEFSPQLRGGMGDIRVVRSIYPPRVELSYTLTDASGKVLAEGKEQLTDLAFHMASSFDIRNDPLFYEKNLLKKWVQSMFKP